MVIAIVVLNVFQVDSTVVVDGGLDVVLVEVVVVVELVVVVEVLVFFVFLNTEVDSFEV